MAQLSNYAETATFNHVLRNTALTSPITVYLALFTTDPTEAGTGTEVSGGSYAREAITMGAPTGGVGTNSTDITFTTATADWGTVGFIGVFDAVTAGNMLMYGAVDTAKAVLNGDTYKVLTGNLSLSLAITNWSTFLRNEMFDHLFRNLSWTSPVTVYSALYLTDPTVADTGTEGSGGSYARQSVAFDAPTDGVGSNTSEVSFPTATTDIGTISHHGLRDALTVGNLLMFGAFTVAKDYLTDDVFKLPAGTTTGTIA